MASEKVQKVYDYRLDYLRILAAGGIILTHMLEMMKAQANAPKPAIFMEAGILAGIACNLIYVMLSGLLLLSGRQNGIMSFYGKRLTRVGIPLILCYWFYLWNNGMEFKSLDSWINAGKMFLSGAPGQAPHVWQIYVLLSLYIAVPFLQIMCQSLSQTMTNVLAAVIFFSSAWVTYLPLAGIQPGIQTWLSAWPGVMILGYWISRPWMRQWDRWMIAGGAAAFIFSLTVIRCREDYAAIVYNCAPNVMLMGCAVFSMIFQLGQPRRGGKLVRLISRHSYSMILLHWYVLYRVTLGRLHIIPEPGNIISEFAAFFVTFAASLVLAVLFDNTAVWGAEKVLAGIFCAIRKCAGVEKRVKKE